MLLKGGGWYFCMNLCMCIYVAKGGGMIFMYESVYVYDMNVQQEEKKLGLHDLSPHYNRVTCIA